MTIRPATEADVSAVLPMVGRLAALHENWDPQRYDYRPDTQTLYAGWLASRARDPQAVFLVAQREEKLVAFLIGTIEKTIPIYRLSQVGYLHDMWVEPEYRHEGIGRQLTMHAIESFLQKGAKQIRLETASANEAARKLFQSCGFRPSTVEMLLEMKPPADAT